MRKNKSLIFVLCAAVLFAVFSLPVFAEDVSFELGNTSGKPGDIVNVTITVSSSADINSIALYELTYDPSVLTFRGFDNTSEITSKSFLAGFDEEKCVITLALKNTEAIDSLICNLQFFINGTADDGTTSVTMTSLVKNASEVISSTVSAGSVTVESESSSPSHTHQMKYVPEQEATCASTGHEAYWTCTSCGNNYSDEGGTLLLTSVTTAKDPHNHTGETALKDEKEATATKDGYTGDTVCMGCGAVLEEGSVIPKKGGTSGETDRPSVNKPETEAPETDRPTSTKPETDKPETGKPETDKSSDITVESEKPTGIVPETPWVNPFVDVKASASYYNAIRFVYENGLFKGVSDTEFEPDTTMTRAMFVTVLGRLEGVDTRYFSTGCSFDDVVEGEWYHPYVEWASEKGIVQGYGDGKFGVDDEITIEQAAVIIARYAKHAGEYKASNASLTAYSDGANTADWALAEMKWAVANGVYTGTSGKLNPQNPASRALVAVMLHNYVSVFTD
ncbi:MAG: hypothetical protein E7638_07090 [Ruminococcaceae bacterium]|nr:hypothetical protein [Oscillospiraceae bacterium]